MIGAIRLCGVSYKEIHGSNWYARHWTNGLRIISSEADLKLGNLIYKGQEVWGDNYDLPSHGVG